MPNNPKLVPAPEQEEAEQDDLSLPPFLDRREGGAEPEEPVSIAKPSGFDLDKFKSKRARGDRQRRNPADGAARPSASRRPRTSCGCIPTKTLIGRPNCAS